MNIDDIYERENKKVNKLRVDRNTFHRSLANNEFDHLLKNEVQHLLRQEIENFLVKNGYLNPVKETEVESPVDCRLVNNEYDHLLKQEIGHLLKQEIEYFLTMNDEYLNPVEDTEVGSPIDYSEYYENEDGDFIEDLIPNSSNVKKCSIWLSFTLTFIYIIALGVSIYTASVGIAMITVVLILASILVSLSRTNRDYNQGIRFYDYGDGKLQKIKK